MLVIDKNYFYIYIFLWNGNIVFFFSLWKIAACDSSWVKNWKLWSKIFSKIIVFKWQQEKKQWGKLESI